jgi:Icc-related predicted phosphoesterase
LDESQSAFVVKLHVLSDLHTEFAEFSPPDTGADVVILAGDIGVGLGGIEWAAGHFPNHPVIYVPGNHEYYGQDITFIEELVKQSPENIHVLNNDTIVLNGVRFLGSTLWTDFRLHGESESWFARQRAKRFMEDFSSIKNGGRTFTPEISVGLHDASRAWIASHLDTHFDGPSIVVTHHLPAAMSVAKRYANDPMNPAFASRLEDIIERYQPDLWIHGHTHEPCDYELFGTRVVCNPRGYPREKRDSTFDPGLVVEITA